MKKQIAYLLIPVLALLAAPVMADHNHRDNNRYDRFDRKLDRQHWRIKKGIRSGQLTHREAKRLRKQHRRIANLKYHFKQDGYLDRYERRTLNRKLNRASDRIYRLKHNDQYRYRAHTYPEHRNHNDDRYHNNKWTVMLDIGKLF